MFPRCNNPPKARSRCLCRRTGERNRVGLPARSDSHGVQVPKTGDSLPSEIERVVTAADRVGQTLRRAFDETATEPLPQAFEELLRRLR